MLPVYCFLWSERLYPANSGYNEGITDEDKENHYGYVNAFCQWQPATDRLQRGSDTGGPRECHTAGLASLATEKAGNFAGRGPAAAADRGWLRHAAEAHGNGPILEDQLLADAELSSGAIVAVISNAIRAAWPWCVPCVCARRHKRWSTAQPPVFMVTAQACA